mmetsp:Transcript_34748/g.66068  ORF Transcript_34748/g.66068 Transcript_34748/m.66068 type:complete len:111 (-) Transcript_34748:66-398(-)
MQDMGAAPTCCASVDVCQNKSVLTLRCTTDQAMLNATAHSGAPPLFLPWAGMGILHSRSNPNGRQPMSCPCALCAVPDSGSLHPRLFIRVCSVPLQRDMGSPTNRLCSLE